MQRSFDVAQRRQLPDRLLLGIALANQPDLRRTAQNLDEYLPENAGTWEWIAAPVVELRKKSDNAGRRVPVIVNELTNQRSLDGTKQLVRFSPR